MHYLLPSLALWPQFMSAKWEAEWSSEKREWNWRYPLGLPLGGCLPGGRSTVPLQAAFLAHLPFLSSSLEAEHQPKSTALSFEVFSHLLWGFRSYLYFCFHLICCTRFSHSFCTKPLKKKRSSNYPSWMCHLLLASTMTEKPGHFLANNWASWKLYNS